MRVIRAILVAGLCLFFTAAAMAEESDRISPFVLADIGSGDFEQRQSEVKSVLGEKGFDVVGSYRPYPGAIIHVITNDDLRRQAAESSFGGYGAALRVAVTEVDGQLQVSYTNPLWMSTVYRMSGDFSTTASLIKSALGQTKFFGSSGGRTIKSLRKYHYMMLMPYFDDHLTLGEYASHGEAVAAVEAGLDAKAGGTSLISRVDVIGKDEVLFNVGISQGEGADQSVMAIIDQAKERHTAHLPYDLLVSGNKVYMLHGKFRIAQSFPDLTLGTFMKISAAPSAIETAFKAVVTGK